MHSLVAVTESIALRHISRDSPRNALQESLLSYSTIIMGIKGLTALLSQHAPNAIKEHEIKTLFGRKVAIDASMSIYQFLIAVRQKDGEMLQNDAGETTSHLMGFFYRTIRIVENGIKPAYVFDGKPPDMKKGVVSSSPVWIWALVRVYLQLHKFSSPNALQNVKKQRLKAKKRRRQELRRIWTDFRVGRSK